MASNCQQGGALWRTQKKSVKSITLFGLATLAKAFILALVILLFQKLNISWFVFRISPMPD
jgi:hypothetical protein